MRAKRRFISVFPQSDKDYVYYQYIPRYPLILYAYNEGSDRTTLIRRLIWVFVVPICNKGSFFSSWGTNIEVCVCVGGGGVGVGGGG